jgi:hypothetical protein
MAEDPILFDVETFAARHPAMDPGIAMFARAALGHHAELPRTFTALREGTAHPAHLSCAEPDERTKNTYERETIVELGAVVLAGLLLHRWEGKQLTRVCKRGARFDYFVGERPEDERWLLEVGGTDEGSHQAKRTEKRKQLEDSPYRRTPFNMAGFVGATRFGEPSVTSLDTVPAEVP